jgi:hypothetical protein
MAKNLNSGTKLAQDPETGLWMPVGTPWRWFRYVRCANRWTRVKSKARFVELVTNAMMDTSGSRRRREFLELCAPALLDGEAQVR